MMGKTSEGEEGASSSKECCMCGDYGLSSELFTCKHCGFRSQHKYCSNLYPEAKSYDICNWCLSQMDGKKTGKNTTYPNKSSSHRSTSCDEDVDIKINKRKRRQFHGGLIKETDRDQIKKMNKFPDRSPGSRKRAFTTEADDGGIGKRIITRTMSEEISNGGGMIVKQVFRNKVRRYKLLDEVSS